MLELFLPVPFHAFFGVAIMMAGSLVVDDVRRTRRPAGASTRCADQGVAGGIVWAFGELPTVLVLAVVFFSWASSDERRGRALDRAADRTGDAELEAYNARLRAMAERTRPRLTHRTGPRLAVDRERTRGRSAPDHHGVSRRGRRRRLGRQVLLGRLDQHRRDQRAERPAAPPPR